MKRKIYSFKIKTLSIAFVFLSCFCSLSAKGNLNSKGENANSQVTTGKMNYEMVDVKGSTFTMGCKGKFCAYNTKPAHEVKVSDYKIGKYEVTQKQWKDVMGTMPKLYMGTADTKYMEFQGDSYPVVAHYEEIMAFIKALNIKTGMNYRLPTEAEWEYAARGGNVGGGYKYSGSSKLDTVGWYSENSKDMQSFPVGQKLPNELGIYDMSGNVAEWCSDFYGDYDKAMQVNPKGPKEGECRIVRGGSCTTSYISCNVLFRQAICDSRNGAVSSYYKSSREDQTSKIQGYGFRLVIEEIPEDEVKK